MKFAKFDIEKLTCSNDFGLWRVKMKAILVQQGIVDALRGPEAFTDTMSETKKKDMLEKAHSSIILCLGDRTLREVAKEKSAKGVWEKLEQLCLTKTLANRLFLKQRFYAFKMNEEKSICEKTDDFHKIFDELENIEIALGEEDKALLLLNSLSKSYENFKDTLIYGREQTITLEEVQSTVRGKEFQKKIDSNYEGSRDGLFVRVESDL